MSTTSTGSVASQRFSKYTSGASLCTGSVSDSLPSFTSFKIDSDANAGPDLICDGKKLWKVASEGPR